jgi:hypothetical protein
VAKKILVVGGGLGGLITAASLADQGFEVDVLEASDRTGGKAGSFFINGRWWDHGWHGFPAFYFNLRGWLKKANVPLHEYEGSLFITKKDQFRKPRHMFLPKWYQIGKLIKLLLNGMLPTAQMLLFMYFMVSKAALWLSPVAWRDRVSRVAFLRKAWYATDAIIAADNDSMLKGTAVASYEMSAQTWQTVIRKWARWPDPFIGVIPGTMQTLMIEPLLKLTLSRGAKVHLKTRATAFKATQGHITGVETVDANGNTKLWTADEVVISIPPEVLRTITGYEVFGQDPEQAGFQLLRAVPMGAVHVVLKNKRTDIPNAPIFFYGGRWGLSFLDMSQLTNPPGATTELSLVMANSAQVKDLPLADQFKLIMAEVEEFTGIKESDVAEYQVIPNTTEPLTINDIGAWAYRPEVKSETFDNLYYANDWTRNPFDLCGMEGATWTAMTAAQLIAKKHGNNSLPTPVTPKIYPLWLMQLLALAMMPLVPLAYVWARLFEDTKAPS